eukprot:Hpha_TRINITY_DN15195_c0_g1::TRINITY_DN15195_c0_g1_i1::g.129631::m.129631
MGFGQWLVGISVGIFSKVIASLGLVLQKRWHTKNAALPIEKRKVWYTDFWWMAGFATYAGGNIITIVALALIPQTIVASLDSLVLVFNAIWAPLLLGEHPGGSDWVWNGVIICGVALVVLYGPSASGEHTGHELVDLLFRPTYIIFATTACLIYLIAAWYGSSVRHSMAQQAGLRRIVSRRFTKTDAMSTPPGSGCCRNRTSKLERRVGTPSNQRQGSSDNLQAPGTGRSLYVAVPVPQPTAAVAAGVAPAVLSCFCLQLSKVVGELVGETATGNNQFFDWPVYFFIGALASVNALQVKMLQTALNDFSALVIVPVFQVSLTVFAVVGGGIYFREFEQWNLQKGAISSIILFSLGLLLCICGVVFLSLRGSDLTGRMLRVCCYGSCCDQNQPQPSPPQGAATPGPTPGTSFAIERPYLETPSQRELRECREGPGMGLSESKLLVHSFVKVPWCEVNGPLGRVEESDSEDEEDEDGVELVDPDLHLMRSQETVPLAPSGSRHRV